MQVKIGYEFDQTTDTKKPQPRVGLIASVEGMVPTAGVELATY